MKYNSLYSSKYNAENSFLSYFYVTRRRRLSPKLPFLITSYSRLSFVFIFFFPKTKFVNVRCQGEPKRLSFTEIALGLFSRTPETPVVGPTRPVSNRRSAPSRGCVQSPRAFSTLKMTSVFFPRLAVRIKRVLRPPPLHRGYPLGRELRGSR